mmetsp:Transcript_16526/g.51785  ORF Transcript_16526/g.51785 Transcript_16526/m.51785 type:complete len:206 (-) Transcript_16526:96-713(-)
MSVRSHTVFAMSHRLLIPAAPPLKLLSPRMSMKSFVACSLSLPRPKPLTVMMRWPPLSRSGRRGRATSAHCLMCMFISETTSWKVPCPSSADTASSAFILMCSTLPSASTAGSISAGSTATTCPTCPASSAVHAPGAEPRSIALAAAPRGRPSTARVSSSLPAAREASPSLIFFRSLGCLWRCSASTKPYLIPSPSISTTLSARV